jgi:N-acetylglucosaminyl-diphospho-decaprenol L-rhamnosyltransferase
LTPEPDVIEPKRVSIVIVSHNRIDHLRRSLEQLGDDHQVLVVDNGSTDGSYAIDEEFPTVRFIRLPKNFGLTKALNIGVRAAEGTYLLLLHDDTVITGDSISKLADYLEEHADTGAVAPLLVTGQGAPGPQVRDLPSPSTPGPAYRSGGGEAESTVPAVSGAAIMFRTSFLRALRQIDERYGTYGSIIELCMQVRRSNRKIVVLGNVTAIHELLASPMSKSALDGDRVAGTAVFLGKHYGLAAGILYRAKSAVAGLFTFRVKVLAGALAGAKIDGNS